MFVLLFIRKVAEADVDSEMANASLDNKLAKLKEKGASLKAQKNWKNSSANVQGYLDEDRSAKEIRSIEKSERGASI